MSYDTSRKLNRVQKFRKVKSSDSNRLDSQYMPVPYNLDIELYVMANQSDDALQIVEQILPYFQPDYTLTIKDMTDMGIKRDVPIVLNSISYEDNYRGEFTERRAIIYTLSFTSKFSLAKRLSTLTLLMPLKFPVSAITLSSFLDKLTFVLMSISPRESQSFS